MDAHLPLPASVASRRQVLLGSAGLAGAAAWAGCRGASPAADPERARDRGAALDELFADLTDQRDGATPIAAAERAARRARLGALLADAGLDAFLCESGATLSYLADVRWGRSERLFGLVVLADGSHF
ncbi:MAG TPA: aminopeptidase P family N-terminal domain-containing protein, partial [Planctomycetota bacterium]|nr:aminopeptidase P family N-terminal domain-containing protein [Planctomycetota bacterium]